MLCCEQGKPCQDYILAQARLSIRDSHRRLVPESLLSFSLNMYLAQVHLSTCDKYLKSHKMAHLF